MDSTSAEINSSEKMPSERPTPTPDTDDILTMAFVNMQPFGKIYNPEPAFRRGTLYPDLDKPFLRGGVN
ncbi:MAG: spore coat associated protein CotJA [Clostridia bacterium]|nr:spore coat associated protein CotJA [Clostridia bacterium]